jgi:hypothetical protein
MFPTAMQVEEKRNAENIHVHKTGPLFWIIMWVE